MIGAKPTPAARISSIPRLAGGRDGSSAPQACTSSITFPRERRMEERTLTAANGHPLPHPAGLTFAARHHRGAKFRARGLQPPCTPATAPARRPPSTPRSSRSSPPRSPAPAPCSGSTRSATRSRGTVRTGICIVGGDVCRASDAAAAGLEPCTVGERALGRGLTLTIASIRFGVAASEWTAAHALGRLRAGHEGAPGRSGGGMVGMGVEASPLGLDFGVRGKVDFAIDTGRAWEFPDAASAARFITDHDEDRVPPTWRFGDAGPVLTGGRAREGRRHHAHRRRGDGRGRRRRPRGPRAHDAVRAREAGLGRQGVAPGRRRRGHGPSTGDGDDGDHERRATACARSASAPPARPAAGSGDRVGRPARPARSGQPRDRRAAAGAPAPVAAGRAVGPPCGRPAHRPGRHGRARGVRGPRRVRGRSISVSGSASSFGVDPRQSTWTAARGRQRLDARARKSGCARTA